MVVLGAGWDTRAWGLLADADVRVFELDKPASQAAKRSAVEAAGLPPDRVTFVSTDFVEKSWLEALTEAGFDPTLPTFFLLEGLIYYLNDDDLGATLRDIATMAPGSRLAFDYLSLELVRGLPPHQDIHRKLMRSFEKNYPNEHLYSGITTAAPARDQALRFLDRHGLTLLEYEPFGPDDEAFGGVVLGVVGD